MQKIAKSRGAMQVHGNASRNTIIVIDNSVRHAPGPSAPSERVTVASVLAALNQLDKEDRLRVLDFMEREFQTRMVKELDRLPLLRTLGYAEAMIDSSNARRPQYAPTIWR